MKIVIRFGKRWYIFFSYEDIKRARAIWEGSNNQDEFEDALENNRIEFGYDLWED